MPDFVVAAVECKVATGTFCSLSAAAKPDPALVLTFEPASEPLTALIVGSLVEKGNQTVFRNHLCTPLKKDKKQKSKKYVLGPQLGSCFQFDDEGLDPM